MTNDFTFIYLSYGLAAFGFLTLWVVNANKNRNLKKISAIKTSHMKNKK
jgi:hypothetical protein